jgi:hypothetical protein
VASSSDGGRGAHIFPGLGLYSISSSLLLLNYNDFENRQYYLSFGLPYYNSSFLLADLISGTFLAPMIAHE